MDQEGAQYQQIARLQYAEIERLRALVAQRDTELEGLISWIAGGTERDAWSTLRGVYLDPRSTRSDVIKAAMAAMPFERAKPASSSVVGIVDYREKVRTIRLRENEKLRAQWAAEDAARTIEHQPTIVSGDGDPAA
jgi:hypothetical protein